MEEQQDEVGNRDITQTSQAFIHGVASSKATGPLAAQAIPLVWSSQPLWLKIFVPNWASSLALCKAITKR
eukprot:2544780-Amphidinium_carterae.2